MLKRHLTPSTFIALLALVFALTGGAFAATGTGSGGSSKATASVTHATVAKSKPAPKGKAGPRGPAGKAGATGATGATGPAGPAGPAGATGPAGAIGPAGAGTPGATGPQGPEGKEGLEGLQGKEGPEGTFGGQKLPSGKTLTGQWAASGYGEAEAGVEGEGIAVTGVTYALPVELESEINGGDVHYIKEDEWNTGKDPAGCTGTASQPGAEPGNLCVFAVSEDNVYAVSPPDLNGVPSAGTAVQNGFQILAFTAAKGAIFLNGSWAVTAK